MNLTKLVCSADLIFIIYTPFLKLETSNTFLEPVHWVVCRRRPLMSRMSKVSVALVRLVVKVSLSVVGLGYIVNCGVVVGLFFCCSSMPRAKS